MAEVFVGGAMLGAGFGELLAAVRGTVKTIYVFKSLFQDLECTLTDIEEISRHIDIYNMLLDRPQEMDRMNKLIKRGKVLSIKCSKTGKLNLWKRFSYSLKLKSFDENIKKFFWINMSLITSRDSKETLVEMKDLRMAFNRLRLDLENGVCVKKSIAFGSCSVPEDPDFVVGLDMSFKDLKKQLLQEGVSVVVVSAPGGCGKTTLVTKICHDAGIKGKFKNIFFTRVSQLPNLMMLIKDMIHSKRTDVPEFRSEDDAVEEFKKLLVEIGEDPVLLVLDDVWPNSEPHLRKVMFESIPDYKILVTSRYSFPGYGTPYQLNELNHANALKLFLHSTIPQNLRSQMSEGEIDNLMKNEELLEKVLKVPAHDLYRIMEHCKGSPLALTIVGRSLSGQDQSVWKSKLIDLSERSLVDSASEVLDCLRRSLVDLEGTPMFKCFMDLGLFPEDHKIPATILIDMWSEELDANGVHADAILHKLNDRNLLDLVITRKEASQGDRCYGGSYVMQHDLLRDLAIHLNNQAPIEDRERLYCEIQGNVFPDWLSKHQKQPFNARILSISTDEKFSSVWPEMEMELPRVEVLLLNFCTKNFTLPPFMAKMVNLKTLIVAHNGFSPAEISNISLLGSLPNLKRIRLEHVKVPFLCMSSSLAHFNNLEKASFFMCNISQDAMISKARFSEAFPKLEEIGIYYCSDLENLPVGICDLRNLRKISIGNCHNLCMLPEELGNLVNLEVLRVNSCTSLMGLPDTIKTLKKLVFLDISNCCNIGRLPSQTGELGKLKEVHINGCLRLSKLPPSVRQLEQLKYVFCDEERCRLWKSLKNRFPNLRVKLVEEDNNLNWLKV